MQALDATTKADQTVDARGSSYPLLEARKGILLVPIGGVLETISSDMETKNDVLIWARKMGHEFLGVVADPRYDRIFVRRLK
jgi:tRNA 2-thiouridine synthesizing protein A